MSNHSPQNPTQRQYSSQETQGTQLTRENLSRVQIAPSNRETYLQRDQNFERVPLGLATNRRDGHVTVDIWQEQWRLATVNGGR
ncbi:hypothetical protein LSUE1_G003833 [Lachnellula suecica]|uniref:Uncharacterized protein n=1 Tax=Lachnellula suecica TaxID=602035 RepID=A0A8T9CCU1_9HELO|nr:hypothetical protein LSUE1_G003833 [Lachnellula suecica]